MAKKTAEIVFRAVNRFTRPVRGMDRAMGRWARNIRRHASNARRSLTAVDNKLKALTASMRRLAPLGGLLGGAALLGGGISAVKIAGEFQAVGTAIEFASGSVEQGAKNMQFLRDISQSLALDYRSAADGYKRFLGATIGQGVTGDGQRQMFEDVSKAVLVLGLDAEQTTSVFRALGEIISKGSLQAQELKVQLANALPGATKDQADALGISVETLYKKMKKGAIDGLTAVKALSAYLGAKYEPGVTKALGNINAKLNLLRNQWNFLKVDVGNILANSGILEYIEEVLGASKAWLSVNKELFAAKTKTFVKTVFESGRKAFNWILENKDNIIGAIKGIGIAYLGLKGILITLSIASLLTNPIALATAALLGLGAAVPIVMSQMKKLRDDNKLTSDSFTNMEVGAMSFNNMLKNDLTANLAGLYQLLIGISKAIFQLGSWLFDFGNDGTAFSRWFDQRANEADEMIKWLEEGAIGKGSERYFEKGGFSVPENSTLKSDYGRSGSYKYADLEPTAANRDSSQQAMLEKIKMATAQLAVNINNNTDSTVTVDTTNANDLILTP